MSYFILFTSVIFKMVTNRVLATVATEDSERRVYGAHLQCERRPGRGEEKLGGGRGSLQSLEDHCSYNTGGIAPGPCGKLSRQILAMVWDSE